MRTSYFSIILTGIVLVVTGCASSEQKFGRGVHDLTEFTRWGEISRSKEQSTLFPKSSVAAPSGFIHGFSRSVARTFVGAYEIVTAPFPPYGPVMEPVSSVYPDSYRPGISSNPIFSTSTHLGFTGGDVAPWSPGSRFTIFDD